MLSMHTRPLEPLTKACRTGIIDGMTTFLYGLDHASHDFNDSSSMGKNIFTNAFPLSLAQYLAKQRNLPIPTIHAELDSGSLTTAHKMSHWEEIIGTRPDNARFEFEGVYRGYDKYTHTHADKSDVVVVDRSTGQHLRPLEIKLVVVPTSSTAHFPKNKQSCEIVVRPPTVEQLAFSIAHSYGTERRYELQEMIAASLGQPNDYRWSDESAMLEALPQILEAAEAIAKGGLKAQTPLVITAVWRSEGQKPILAENAFDVFTWTDMAFVQLFIDAAHRTYYDKNGHRKKLPATISRPNRALVWLVNSLWDYTTQGSLNFGRIHSEITFGVQSDKAASFTGHASLKHLESPEFFDPRITRNELENILSPTALEHLMPERRLDAAIAIQHLLNQERFNHPTILQSPSLQISPDGQGQRSQSSAQ